MATMNFPILDSNYLVRLRTCNVADLPLDFTFGQKIFTKNTKTDVNKADKECSEEADETFSRSGPGDKPGLFYAPYKHLTQCP